MSQQKRAQYLVRFFYDALHEIVFAGIKGCWRHMRTGMSLAGGAASLWTFMTFARIVFFNINFISCLLANRCWPNKLILHCC